MPDPTVYTIPRRRMSVAPYFVPTGENPILRDVGVIDSAAVEFELENNEYRATDMSTGACREYVADASLTSSVGAMTVGMMSDVAANLAMALKSTVATVATASIVDEPVASGLVVGDIIEPAFLPDPSTLVLTDSDAGPTTLIEGTHYEFIVKKTGTVRILDITALTEPVLFTYTSLETKDVSPMTSMDDYWYISLSGGNERNSCGGEAERIYRVRVTEANAKTLHQPAETRVPEPMEVTLTVDRDPARNYEFANFIRLT